MFTCMTNWPIEPPTEELAEDLREWVTDLCTRGEADA